MPIEKYNQSEVPPTSRVLEGAEREKFVEELSEYITGLEEALADLDLTEEERAEFEEQLAGLRDAQAGNLAGGSIGIEE